MSKSPHSVIRECDLILDGTLTKTQEQMNRWLVVQIKKLANQSSARRTEHLNLQRKVKAVK